MKRPNPNLRYLTIRDDGFLYVTTGRTTTEPLGTLEYDWDDFRAEFGDGGNRYPMNRRMREFLIHFFGQKSVAMEEMIYGGTRES